MSTHPRSQYQSGSTVIFVVVSVLLTAAVIGAIIVAQHRGDTSSPIATTDTQNQDAPALAGSDTQKSEADRQAQAKAEADKKAAEKAAADKKVQEVKAAEAAKQKADADKKAADAQAAQQQAAAGPMTQSSADAAHPGGLPTTGPTEDLLSAAVAIVAISGAGYVYYHFGRKS